MINVLQKHTTDHGVLLVLMKHGIIIGEIVIVKDVHVTQVSRVKHHSLGGFPKNLQCSLNQGKNKEMAPQLLAFKEAPRLSL